ncbi:PglZ domain-containing protein, partial [bacterium]
LEEPAVRDALTNRGVALGDWSGEREALDDWAEVSEDEKPLVKVARGARLHLIDESLPNASRLDVGVSLLFPKLDPEAVRAVPRGHWDALLRIQETERPLRTRRESALMVARVVYGVDYAFVQEHGWTRALAQVAASGESIPALIVEELLGAVEGRHPEKVRAALGDAALARAFAKGDDAAIGDPVAAALRSQTKEARRSPSYDEGFLAEAWSSPTLAPTQVQALALRYGASLAEGLPKEVRVACNGSFGAWLRRSYDLMLTSQNPSVYRAHRLAETIDRRLGADRGVVFVVDALSFEAWFAVKRVWLEVGVIAGAEEDAAFAVVPTLTSWSRRAFFEGRLPPQFEQGAHGPALERRLWERRFERARYFSVGEEAAYREAIYQGAPRIAVVDVSWDKRGHALDPDYDTLAA